MTFPAVDSLDTYGGELADYGIGVVDPTTDRSAASANQAFASVAAMTETCARALVAFTYDGSAVTRNKHRAAWGHASAVAPTCARTSTGLYTVTWATSYTDFVGDTYTTNLEDGCANVAGSGFALAIVELTAANVATIRIYDAAGNLTDVANRRITVWTA